jgi:hypothetical protein
MVGELSPDDNELGAVAGYACVPEVGSSPDIIGEGDASSSSISGATAGAEGTFLGGDKWGAFVAFVAFDMSPKVPMSFSRCRNTIRATTTSTICIFFIRLTSGAASINDSDGEVRTGVRLRDGDAGDILDISIDGDDGMVSYCGCSSAESV